ncbi:MAG TPA: LSM domain-containing protein [Candidatus Acidoferrales bacterium]|nr:LSM domain-containing protein [Candidatus Acidoferrales bacterium]
MTDNDNDTTNAFNKSEILPFTFINELVNQKVVVKTRVGDYTGMLKGWDDDLNVTLADVAEIKEMKLIRLQKTILIRGGDISHITSAGQS